MVIIFTVRGSRGHEISGTLGPIGSASMHVIDVLLLVVHVPLTAWHEGRDPHPLSLLPAFWWSCSSQVQPLQQSSELPVRLGGRLAGFVPTAGLSIQRLQPRAVSWLCSSYYIPLLSTAVSQGWKILAFPPLVWITAELPTDIGPLSQTGVPRTKRLNPFLSTERKMPRAYFKRC